MAHVLFMADIMRKDNKIKLWAGGESGGVTGAGPPVSEQWFMIFGYGTTCDD